MSPVESVARAMAQRQVAAILGPGRMVDELVYGEDGDEVPFWHLFIPDARAALAAIRTPTPKMIEALIDAYWATEEHDNDAWAAIWQAAIDAAMGGTDG